MGQGKKREWLQFFSKLFFPLSVNQAGDYFSAELHSIFEITQISDAIQSKIVITILQFSNIIYYQKSFSMLLVSAQAQIMPLDTKNLQTIAYAQVQKALQVHEYFSNLLKLQHPKLHNNKLITSKMRAKLFNWLQKVALRTFNFSIQTLITAASIVDQYLDKSNQSPSTLQLIGCAALLIASKLKEEIIVDPECYLTASCNVFTKKQLLEKQKTLYLKTDWKKVRKGALYGLRLGSQILNVTEYAKIFEPHLWESIKDEQKSSWKQAKIIYSVLSLMVTDPGIKIQANSIFGMGLNQQRKI